MTRTLDGIRVDIKTPPCRRSSLMNVHQIEDDEDVAIGSTTGSAVGSDRLIGREDLIALARLTEEESLEPLMTQDTIIRPTSLSRYTRVLSSRLFVRFALFIAIAIISLAFALFVAHTTLSVSLPQSLQQVKSMALDLEHYASESWTGYMHVSTVYGILYLWQQAFSIPGSILLNLLGGYLYGIVGGSVYTSLLTAIGASLAYLLAKLIGEPFMEIGWFERKLVKLKNQVERNRQSLFFWLLFIRLFPLTPYWFINMTAPILTIPLSPFFASTLLGVLPYNFITCQAGSLLNELRSTSDIFSASLLLKLAIVSAISLVPVVIGNQLKDMVERYTGVKQDVEMDPLDYQLGEQV